MALHPVGPLPASTYWWRRGGLAAVLVVVLVLLRSCLGGGGGGHPVPHAHPSSSPAPVATTQPAPSSTHPVAATAPPPPTAPTNVTDGTCTDAQLRLSPATDAASYPAGTSPRFTVSVTNTSATSCRRDLGGLEVLVYSSTDRIWSSRDCAPAATADVQSIAPGKSLQTTRIWNGTRSVPGCAGIRTQARPGTYTVRARVGTLVSPVVVFRITG